MAMKDYTLVSNFSTKNYIERYSYSFDAGVYRLLPEIVSFPKSDADILKLFEYCRAHNKSITFRAAGTSLSGQSVGNSIIADISRHLYKFKILDNGNSVSTQPGAIFGKTNDALLPFGKKLGPDPASIASCMAGGVISNNSSGMTSGTDRNPYNTVRSIKFMFANGHRFDTASPDYQEDFKAKCPEIFSGLQLIRAKIYSDPDLKHKIELAYKIKNTIGYSLNAFIDKENPADIMAKLLIGSEGTLAYISEIVWETFPISPFKSTFLVIFPNITEACKAIPHFKMIGANVIELLDDKSLKSGSDNTIASEIQNKYGQNSSALLVEFEQNSEMEKSAFLDNYLTLFGNLAGISGIFQASTEDELESIWALRKGILTTIGSKRPAGTSIIIEDIAFRIEDFPTAVADLRILLDSSGYIDAAIYGHGTDGNIHFLLSQRFDSEEEINRYSIFMKELCNLVVDKYSGSLKAEHGTGRNLAPFVRRQWGDSAWNIMKEIKQLIDPAGILNPDVIISNDDNIHLKNLKSMPPVNKLIDACIECGFCESHCPSRYLTATPRKRIAILRAMAEGKKFNMSELEYYLQETCATDGMCETACPVGINTGSMVKVLRNQSISSLNNMFADLIANNVSKTYASLGIGLKTANIAGNIIGDSNLESFCKAAGSLPKWNRWLGTPAEFSPEKPKEARYVYFPCCTSRIMGTPDGLAKSIIDTMLSLGKKAGIAFIMPESISDTCCGMAFHSKGYFAQYRKVVSEFVENMYEASLGGKYPIVMDSSSCTYSVRHCEEYLDKDALEKYKDLKILDSIEFASEILAEKLKFRKISGPVIIHVNCSAQKMKLENKFREIVSLCCDNVFLPLNNSCCGFAGDRGLYYPELTMSATKREVEEIAGINSTRLYSSNIPCEAGMSMASGKKYLSFLYLLDEASE